MTVNRIAKRNSILILNCPEATEIFLNFKFFKTAKAFKGFKFVSEDLHFLSLQTKQFASAFFIKLEPDTVYVLEYKEKEEVFNRVTDQKKLNLISRNVFDFDQYLAPVDYNDYGEFLQLVDLITDELMSQLPKEISLMASWSLYTQELETRKKNDLDLVERMENCNANEDSTSYAAADDKTLVRQSLVRYNSDASFQQYNHPKDFIPFTKIDLKNSFMALDRIPTASEITKHSLDKSVLLMKLSPELLLQELQLSYLLITLQIWDAFEHFKNILILFSKSSSWWYTSGMKGLRYIELLKDILKAGKEIWQEVGLDQPNFLQSCLIDLFGIFNCLFLELSDDENLNEETRKKILELKCMCEDIFEWSFDAEDEYEEDLPAIVALDN